jgi:integrase
MNRSRRPRNTGSVYKVPGSRLLKIKYYVEGKCIRESTGTELRTKAENMLADRLAEIRTDTFINPKDRKLTVADLWHGELEVDYRNAIRDDDDRVAKERLLRAERLWKARLEEHFGHMKARNLTTDKLNHYAAWMKKQGWTNATINRDMAALRRAFYLGQEAGKITRIPKFPHLAEADPRSGFVVENVFRALIANAQELWLHALVKTAYTFGWRRGELLRLRCDRISLTERSVLLNHGETKNKTPKWVPLEEDLFVLLQALVLGKKPDDFVFTRKDGTQVRDFRDEWHNLCCAAGQGRLGCPDCSDGKKKIFIELDADRKCPQCGRKPKDPKYSGLLFHDLRRSAGRNGIRRGVQQKVVMEIGGWKTPSVFQRYNIIDETDIRLAVKKIAEGAKAEAGINFGHSLGTGDAERPAGPLQIPPKKILPD